MLGKNLVPGTPVALAEGVSFSTQASPAEAATIRELYSKTYGWAKAWSDKSKKFFDYYDADAYAIAQGQSFVTFRAQKERVFKNVKRIDVSIRNVQALQGPGYWVTWFQQDYRASNMATKGVRRLYWHQDAKGELRIVGMEWAPHLSGTLTAGLNGAPIAEERAAVAVAEVKPVVAVSEPVPQIKVEPKIPAIAGAGPGTGPGAGPGIEPEKPVVVAVAEPKAAAKPAPSGPKVTDVPAFVEKWRAAWEKGDIEAYAACYALDAVQGAREGRKAIRSHKRALWKRSHPAHVELTNIRIISKQDGIVVDMHQAYTDSRSFADMGVKTLYLKPDGNAWRISREDWSPMQQ
ncbi:MAG: hypothetical protein DELT_00077 [Desulfovibrio sp.]